MPALDQGRLGPRFPRRPLHPYSLAMPQHGAACHPPPSRLVKRVSQDILFLATFPLFPFSLHSVILFGHPREIYCFGVLANPRFRRSERSAFGIISRCKRSCLGSSRFPLVNPLETVKIIHSIGRKAKPSRREQATQSKERANQGGESPRTRTRRQTPRGKTHTYIHK